MDNFVTLSEAKNLSCVWTHEKKGEILRFAQNDKNSGGFFCNLQKPD